MKTYTKFNESSLKVETQRAPKVEVFSLEEVQSRRNQLIAGRDNLDSEIAICDELLGEATKFNLKTSAQIVAEQVVEEPVLEVESK